MSAAFMPPEVESEQRESVLGRTNPLVKLGIALAWLLGLGLTLDVRPPLILTFVAIFAGLQLGSIPQGALARRLAPFALAVLGIALANLLFSTQNPDPLARELLRLGPLRITVEAVAAAAGVGARVASIVTVGAVFALTTDMTRLIDSLVQLGRVSPRFAYGALAAYQAVPRLADDLGTLRGARRLRGLPGMASTPVGGAARARDSPRGPARGRDGFARLRRRPKVDLPADRMDPARRDRRRRRPRDPRRGAGDRGLARQLRSSTSRGRRASRPPATPRPPAARPRPRRTRRSRRCAAMPAARDARMSHVELPTAQQSPGRHAQPLGGPEQQVRSRFGALDLRAVDDRRLRRQLECRHRGVEPARRGWTWR